VAKIIQAYDNVLAAGSHYYWVRVNDAGQATGQMHGFASNGGVPTPTAVSGSLLATSNYTMEFGSQTPQRVAIEASEAMIDALWAAGKVAKDAINAQNYSYNAADLDALGHNSNAVFSTIGAAMKLEMVDFKWTWSPGFGEIIIPQTILEEAFNSAMALLSGGPAGGGGGGGGDMGEGVPGGGSGPNPGGSNPMTPGGYWQNPNVVSPGPEQEQIVHQQHAGMDIGLIGVSSPLGHIFELA
jgi:hypothetical protein